MRLLGIKVAASVQLDHPQEAALSIELKVIFLAWQFTHTDGQNLPLAIGSFGVSGPAMVWPTGSWAAP